MHNFFSYLVSFPEYLLLCKIDLCSCLLNKHFNILPKERCYMVISSIEVLRKGELLTWKTISYSNTIFFSACTY